MPNPEPTARRLAAAAACVALSQSACVPFIDSGYDVLGDGRRARSPYIYLSNDRLKIAGPEDIHLEIYVQAPTDEPLTIWIDMHVPNGKRVRWLSDELSYASPAWAAPRQGQLSDIHDFGGGNWPATTGLTSTRTGSWWAPAAPYHVVAGTTSDGRNVLGDSDDPVREFTVDLPPLDANGTIFDPGTLTIRRYRRWVLGMIAQ